MAPARQILRVFYDRLVDDKDRSWFLSYVRSVMKDRLAADFDRLFAHLRPEGAGAEVTIEDVRKCFFGDYMDGNGEVAMLSVLTGRRRDSLGQRLHAPGRLIGGAAC